MTYISKEGKPYWDALAKDTRERVKKAKEKDSQSTEKETGVK